MSMEITITSPKNPRIKNLINLQKPGERRKTRTFTIEGVREVSLARQVGYELVELFWCEELYQEDSAYPIDMEGAYRVTKEVYSKIAYRDGSGGVIAVAKMRDHSLDLLPPEKNPIYLVLERVEKPGNIGAILRTADAGAVSGLIICDPACDFYNPNVVRSSLGCVFTVPLASCSNEDLLAFLKKNGINTFATLLDAATHYAKESFTGPTAFILGAESDGLSAFWQENADVRIKIPMKGKIDSLNVSNAAAIFLFEALRQREG